MYYGMTYNKFVTLHDNYNTLEKYGDKYSALKFANEEWQKENDCANEKDTNRLLTIVDKDNLKIAFFQFSDFDTCNKFADNQNEIIWSENSENKIWNGNIHLMG